MSQTRWHDKEEDKEEEEAPKEDVAVVEKADEAKVVVVLLYRILVEMTADEMIAEKVIADVIVPAEADPDLARLWLGLIPMKISTLCING